MKNIHLLPTEKPSRIFDCFGKLSIGDFNATRESLQVTNQHIYITSDEEIKEGDAVIHDFGMGYELENPCDPDNLKSNTRSKIILTTDQDLIADGVQAIDDEFLEWFVKNPSCESVETKVVDFEVDMGLGDECIEHGSYYKIILPQGKLTYSESAKKEERIFNSTMMSKQETLEEAANRLFYTVGNEGISSIDSFMKGASYQAERMYSKEKVIDILYSFHKEENSRVVFSLSGITKWFEQFKNK